MQALKIDTLCPVQYQFQWNNIIDLANYFCELKNTVKMQIKKEFQKWKKKLFKKLIKVLKFVWKSTLFP